jgi:hypothetical protein
VARFTSFVIFAEMRTGSNFLEANLNALPGVTCHGEVFNPHFIGKLNQTALFGMDLAAREADPLAMLARLRSQTQGIAGFRYFHDHDPRVLPAVMADEGCAKIVLTRNPLESYVSLKIAQATGQWKLTNPAKLRHARARFDGPEFEAHVGALQAFQIRLMHMLQASGQAAFWIDYEDIGDLEVLNGLARFLGVAGRLEATDETLKKQNPEDIADKVENPEAIGPALARLDRFNLGRTPNFEPRRAAAIPSFLAAGPLLFMPVRGGPEAVVRDWMARIGLVTGDFTQKSLRHWRRTYPRHRSFAVLRDPLLRAEAAFRDRILTGALPEIRGHLKRVHKLDLPRPGTPMDPDAYREAFLAFLRFARLNLSGQTGLRVDAHIATQTAVLQGFASHQGPDLVLREERLAEGLRFLCDEAGIACPPLPDLRQPTATRDAELEEAARDAYARDYVGLGLG